MASTNNNSNNNSNISAVMASPHSFVSPAGQTTVLEAIGGFFLVRLSHHCSLPAAAMVPTLYAKLPSQFAVLNVHVDIDDGNQLVASIIGQVGANTDVYAVSSFVSSLKSLYPSALVQSHKNLVRLRGDAGAAYLLEHIHARKPKDLLAMYTNMDDSRFNIDMFCSHDCAFSLIDALKQLLDEEHDGGSGSGGSSGTSPATPSPMSTGASSSSSSSCSSITSDKRLYLPPACGPSSRSPLFDKAGAPAPNNNAAATHATSSTSSSGHGSVIATAVVETTSTLVVDARPAPSAMNPNYIEARWWCTRRDALLALQNGKFDSALYVYSLNEIKRNIDKLKSIGVDTLFFAMKSCNYLPVLRFIVEQGLGLECVSLEELKFIRQQFPQLDKDKILFTPNFAPRHEYEDAYEYAGHITLDNVYPLVHWSSSFAHRSVFLRMDPGQGLGHHVHVVTGGARSKFGIAYEQLMQHKELFDKHDIKVVGLHVHKGSGIHDSNVWAKTAQFLTTLIQHFPHIRYLDLGGGLGVQYKSSDPVLDLEGVRTSIAACRASLPHVSLWLEPGRFVVATACVLLTSVTQLKQKTGRNFIGVNTGMNTLIRPALYESYHEIVNLTRLPSHFTASDLAIYDVVGPICETGDVLGNARSMPVDTQEGDVLLVDTCGAYGRVMSSDYNMRKPAIEMVLEENDA